MSQEALIIQEYSKNPIWNYEMDDSTVSYSLWNEICWDDIVVYLKIDNDLIKDCSYAGNPSTITAAAASLLVDLIVWESIFDVLGWTQQRFVDEWFIVSYRRRRSSVSGLLAARNAIHKYLNDWSMDDYEDVLL